jgi:hypothetical protein
VARDLLTPLYGETLARRFMIMMLRITRATLGMKSAGRPLADNGELCTVADAVSFFQSRRRHFVSLLYMMPSVCRGTRRLPPEMAFEELLPLIEHCCSSFTGWHWKGVLAEVFKRLCAFHAISRTALLKPVKLHLADAERMPIGPCTFDKHVPNAAVSGLGNAAPSDCLSG